MPVEPVPPIDSSVRTALLGSRPIEIRPVFWQLDHLPTAQLSHLHTLVSTDPWDCQDQSLRGTTVWCHSTRPVPSCVAWEWARLDSGIITFADPSAIRTNIHLVDATGCVLPKIRLVREIFPLLDVVDWRSTVAAMLAQH